MFPVGAVQTGAVNVSEQNVLGISVVCQYGRQTFLLHQTVEILRLFVITQLKPETSTLPTQHVSLAGVRFLFSM